MLNQLGFDFGGSAAPSASFVEDVAGTWIDPSFTTAEYVAMFATADAELLRIVGPGRALFALGIEAAKAEHDKMLARGCAPAGAYRLWRSTFRPSPEQLFAFFEHCNTHAGTTYHGIEYKARDDKRIFTAAMFVENIGTVIAHHWKDVGGIGVDFRPFRVPFFLDSYHDNMPTIEAPYHLWGTSYCADKLANSNDDIASVPAFTIQGRMYLNTGGMGSGEYRECDGWALCPKSDWTGPTYSYRTQCRAWDEGRKERGDKRGLVVRVQGQLCVCESPALIFDRHVAKDVDLYRADDDEPVDELGDDDPDELPADDEESETACDLLAA